MLAGPALLTETLVLVDVIDARAVHARVRLALVDLCSSKQACFRKTAVMVAKRIVLSLAT